MQVGCGSAVGRFYPATADNIPTRGGCPAENGRASESWRSEERATIQVPGLDSPIARC